MWKTCICAQTASWTATNPIGETRFCLGLSVTYITYTDDLEKGLILSLAKNKLKVVAKHSTVIGYNDVLTLLNQRITSYHKYTLHHQHSYTLYNIGQAIWSRKASLSSSCTDIVLGHVSQSPSQISFANTFDDPSYEYTPSNPYRSADILCILPKAKVFQPLC